MSNTDKTCKNCRWWAPNFQNKPPKTVEILIDADVAFKCHNPRLDYMHYAICGANSNCAGIDGGTVNDDLHFVTGKDFGCVQFEEKPTS